MALTVTGKEYFLPILGMIGVDVKNNNHAVVTFTRCPSLFYFEKMESLKDIECLCGPGGCDPASSNTCNAWA